MRKKQRQKKQTRKKQKGCGLVFANGGSCGTGTCSFPSPMAGGGCDSCGAKPPMMPLPAGITPSNELLRGGNCGCSMPPAKSPWKNLTGGACPCEAVSSRVPVALGGYKQAKRRTRRTLTHTASKGGYKATKRNLKYLKRWKQGKSIGFTMRSSLKAKGLIPRANGTYKVSPKYKRTK